MQKMHNRYEKYGTLGFWEHFCWICGLLQAFSDKIFAYCCRESGLFQLIRTTNKIKGMSEVNLERKGCPNKIGKTGLVSPKPRCVCLKRVFMGHNYITSRDVF